MPMLPVPADLPQRSFVRIEVPYPLSRCEPDDEHVIAAGIEPGPRSPGCSPRGSP